MTVQPLDLGIPVSPCNIALRINPDLDIAELARAYRGWGHVRVERILAEGAREMFAWFDRCSDWIQLISADGGAIEIDYADWIAMASDERAAIEQEMYRRAVDGFQYSYAAMRVPDEDERLHGGDPMTVFAEFMESADTQDFLEAVTGTRSPAFNDGQATAYGTGDFLTGHDDDVAGRCRTTACVFGLTPSGVSNGAVCCCSTISVAAMSMGWCRNSTRSICSRCPAITASRKLPQPRHDGALPSRAGSHRYLVSG